MVLILLTRYYKIKRVKKVKRKRGIATSPLPVGCKGAVGGASCRGDGGCSINDKEPFFRRR